MSKIALDTNILIYSHFLENKKKRTVAHELLTLNPVISTQVISEYINVMKRLLSVSKVEILKLCAEWMNECKIKTVERSTIITAGNLIKHYDFQIFDSIIVASALEAGCQTLYSEDMQHQLVVERRLSIINPFKI